MGSLSPLGESVKVHRIASSNVLAEEHGMRKWILNGEPEQDWWMEIDSDFERLPGDWEYDRAKETVTCQFLSFEDEELMRRKESKQEGQMRDLIELVDKIGFENLGKRNGSEMVKARLVESSSIVVEVNGPRKWYPIHRVKDDAWVGFDQDGERIQGYWSYNEAEGTMCGCFYSKEKSAK